MARGYYTRSGHRRLGLPQRRADPALDLRLQQPPATARYAGQGNHQLSVADVDARRPRRDRLRRRWPSTTTARGLWNTGTRPRRRRARRRPRSRAAPAWRYFKVDEDASKPGSWMADARTGQILWSTPAGARQRPRRLRRHLGRQRRRRVVVRRPTRSCATPPAQTIGRKPGSTNFLAWWDGDTVRELLDGTHIDKYGTGGDTRLLTGVRRARPTTAPSRPRRCPATSSATGARRSSGATSRQHRAAHLRDADRDDAPRVLDPAARPDVPGRDRLAEHRLQPAAAHRVLPGHAVHAAGPAEDLDPLIYPAGRTVATSATVLPAALETRDDRDDPALRLPRGPVDGRPPARQRAARRDGLRRRRGRTAPAQRRHVLVGSATLGLGARRSGRAGRRPRGARAG